MQSILYLISILVQYYSEEFRFLGVGESFTFYDVCAFIIDFDFLKDSTSCVLCIGAEIFAEIELVLFAARYCFFFGFIFWEGVAGTLGGTFTFEGIYIILFFIAKIICNLVSFIIKVLQSKSLFGVCISGIPYCGVPEVLNICIST